MSRIFENWRSSSSLQAQELFDPRIRHGVTAIARTPLLTRY